VLPGMSDMKFTGFNGEFEGKKYSSLISFDFRIVIFYCDNKKDYLTYTVLHRWNTSSMLFRINTQYRGQKLRFIYGYRKEKSEHKG